MSDETRRFLGQCMNKPDILLDTLVKADDFIDPIEKMMYETIQKIQASGHTPSFDVVAKEMHEPMSYVMEISDSAQIASNWKWYEKAVIEQSRKHRLRQIAEKVLNDEFLPSEDILREIGKVDETRSRYSVVDTVSTVDETLETIRERQARGDELIGITTGLRDLDRVLFGFQKRRLYYIGARPSMGKTMLLLNFLAECNVPAGFMSVESSHKELTMRMIARHASLDSELVMLGHLGHAGMARVEDAGIRMKAEMNYEIYDESNMHIRTLINKAWQMKRRLGIRILFVDYLQAISYPEGGKKYEQVQEISKMLKDLARDLDIPVVVSAQLRRDAEAVRPKLSDFSDSTQVERDADVAIMIHRNAEDLHSPIEQIRERIYLLVEKNRDGKLADLPVYMNPNLLRIHC
jgi:replicative DNA helicase